MVGVSKVCPICGQVTVVSIPKERYEEWQFGVSLNDAWPEGDSYDKETLKSGKCRNCQDGVIVEGLANA